MLIKKSLKYELSSYGIFGVWAFLSLLSVGGNKWNLIVQSDQQLASLSLLLWQCLHNLETHNDREFLLGLKFDHVNLI